MLDALTPEELQFIKGIEKYKKLNDKQFLSWTEVLKVMHAMGYRKVAKPEAIPRLARRKSPARQKNETETPEGTEQTAPGL